MFAYMNNTKYIIGEHHRLICAALDKVIRGENRKLIINIAPRYGKAIDVDTLMLTTKGFKKASEIVVGDYLFGSDGKPTKVLGVFPQGKTDAYKVEFTDKSSLITCGEHLWFATKRMRHPKQEYKGEIVKTKELVDNLYETDNHKRWHIPMCHPLLSSSDLLIEPYLFGCWLGDGSSYKAEITTMDDSISNAFSRYGITIRGNQNSGRAICYGIRGNFIKKLRLLGVVGNKRIPDSYFLASAEDRWQLLMGLCDTDGTCNRKNGQISICLTKDDLREDLKTLLSSLGIYYTEYRKSIFFRSNRCPFTLERKKQYWKPINKHHFTKRFISNVQKVEDRETICFTVDAPDHLYCAGRELILTHNTELCSKMFIAYGLALNPEAKFLHLSYSGSLVQENSVAVKDIINSDYFKAIFDTRIKRGADTKSKWSTEQGGGEYATSTLGQITGFGAGKVDKIEEDEEAIDYFTVTFNPDRFAGAIVIDDPLKPDDALSDNIREQVNLRFETTIRNRVNSRKTPIVIIMQRLHEHDLCGYLQEIEPDEWTVLSIPAIQIDENGNERALWPFKHSLEELHAIEHANDFVFQTQYMQNPTPREGLMYRPFKTYDELPPRKKAIRFNYTDSADTGSDWLCSICCDVHPFGYYVTDVLYSKKPVEYTEQAMAQMLSKQETDKCYVESNNGGRIFMRNVEKICREYENRKTQFIPFAQTKNKAVRIFTRANEVNNMIYFPSDWESRWPEFAHDLKAYRKEGRNAHDDACLIAGTLVATPTGNKPIENIKTGDKVITPFGVRKVLASGKTGHKEVITKFGLTATPNHHVFHKNGFEDFCICNEKFVSLYSFKEQVLWKYKKLLRSMESNIDLWGRESIILVSQQAMLSESVLKDFMLRFGNFIIKGKFRKAIVFIMLMAIHLITTSAIWSVYQLSNICRNIQKRIGKNQNIGKGQNYNLTKQGLRQTNGIEVQKGENGTHSTQKIKLSLIRNAFVRIAAISLWRKKEMQCSVAKVAEKNIGGDNLTTSAYVKNVEWSSVMEKEMQANQTGHFVVSLAEQNIPTNTADVYNIKVDTDGCFYANGILVSNCDAITGVIEKASSTLNIATDAQLMNDFL
jgi:predicted phage terminase large subunit-like protein